MCCSDPLPLLAVPTGNNLGAMAGRVQAAYLVRGIACRLGTQLCPATSWVLMGCHHRVHYRLLPTLLSSP